jgi:FKBP-type peptidyl-prolyl cis-trans isomerase 2
VGLAGVDRLSRMDISLPAVPISKSGFSGPRTGKQAYYSISVRRKLRPVERHALCEPFMGQGTTMRTIRQPIILRFSTLILFASAAAGIALPLDRMAGTSGSPGTKLHVVEGSKVTIEYRITLPDHTVIPPETAKYVQGKHEIPPAVEDAVTGMTAGEETRVDLSVDQAFGPYDESKRVVVERKLLPPDVYAGMVLELADGQPVRVAAVSGTVVVLDFNHPLAGLPLTLDVKILNVEGMVI